ncbi:hypothetical protein ACFX1X_005190 [Malus domestica]
MLFDFEEDEVESGIGKLQRETRSRDPKSETSWSDAAAKNLAVVLRFAIQGRSESLSSTCRLPSVFGVYVTVVKYLLLRKDVTIQPEPAVSARIFLPKIQDPAQKLPVLLYLHGGGFIFESAFSPIFHNFVDRLAVEAHAIVEYGLFPDRPVPACYEDSWAALKWLASHASGDGTESWLNKYANFDRLFIGGDSGGANLSHYLAVRVGSIGQPDLKIGGVVLVHPFFGGLEEDDQMFLYICPENGGLEDRRLRPLPKDFKRLACGKMLIFFAAGDHLRGAG